MRLRIPAGLSLPTLMLLLILPAGAQNARYPNRFSELLGVSDDEVGRRIDQTWHQLFYGDDRTQRVFYPLGDDMAYITDVANHDVRTEGMSYGMMIAVQLNHQHEFDQLWRFARRYMYHENGPLKGYFAWHTDVHGKQLAAGPACDGEEWFATALLYAGHRWPGGQGLLDYTAQGRDILRTMLHKHEQPDRGEVTDMFNAHARQVTFVPDAFGYAFTDPSYHVPFFYELWSKSAASAEDRAFFAAAAVESRRLWRAAANEQTGLMPDYSHFDGTPFAHGNHGNFAYDAWRTLAYPALDYVWGSGDASEVAQSNRVLRYFAGIRPKSPSIIKLDGTPILEGVSPGLFAMQAVAALVVSPDLAKPFIERLWSMPIPEGEYRYYDGLLTLLGRMECGGRFRSY